MLFAQFVLFHFSFVAAPPAPLDSELCPDLTRETIEEAIAAGMAPVLSANRIEACMQDNQPYDASRYAGLVQSRIAEGGPGIHCALLMDSCNKALVFGKCT